MAKKDKKKLTFGEKKIQHLFEDVYNGDVNPYNLPEDLYLAIGSILLSGVQQGFGEISIKFGEADLELIGKLQENIYLFSAAKTFQQTLEMSNALVDDKGELRSFEDFKVAANEIFTRYNGGEIDDEIRPGWLEAEYNTAISQAAHAKKWSRVEAQKEILPYLIRNEVDDAAECDICEALNGICLPVDHPFWDENGGDLHFNCRGIVEQVEREEGEKNETDDDEVDEKVKLADAPANFRFNPGKRGEVFATNGKAQHPYFQVPKEFTKFAEENFNLNIPDDSE